MAKRIFVITPLDMGFEEYHSYVDAVLSHAQAIYGHCRLIWTREIPGVKVGGDPLENVIKILNHVKKFEGFYCIGPEIRQDVVVRMIVFILGNFGREIYRYSNIGLEGSDILKNLFNNEEIDNDEELGYETSTTKIQ